VNQDEQSEISHSLYESRDDRSVRTDAGDKSAFVPHTRAESAVRAVKDKLTKQYESRIEVLEAKLALTEKSSRRTRHAKANNPVEGMVDQVLEQASSPLSAWTMPQAMEPIQQVAPWSYVGRAMGMDKHKKLKSKINKKRRNRSSPEPSEDNSSSSSSSESSSSDSSKSSESSSD
jgi:hypothetical protein